MHYTGAPETRMHSLLLASTSFATAAVLTLLVRRWTMRRNILDHPGSRSSHTAPTPRGGGIAIVLVVLGGMVVVDLAQFASILPYVAASFVIGIIGLIDDVRGMAALPRLAVQLLAAVVAWLAYGRLDHLSLSQATSLSFGAAGGILTILWIVGLTNCFNFMDGINGIAGGVAVIAGSAWAVIGAQRGDRVLIHLGILLATTSLGFLLHNWSRGRIFMGDVGSTFLGYSLAVAALIGTAGKRDVLIPVLLVWPFLFDTGLTLLRRLQRRENVLAAHRSHLYQRLVIGGWSHSQTAALYIVLAAVGAVGAVGIDRGTLPHWPVLTFVAAGSCALWLLAAAADRRKRA